MKLTVLEFAKHYRIEEAAASKLLRRAALDERLEVGYDGDYKATYIGSSEQYLELSREYRARKPQRLASRPSAREIAVQPPPVQINPWAGLLPSSKRITAPHRGFFNGGTRIDRAATLPG